jgi:hypothetical protein
MSARIMSVPMDRIPGQIIDPEESVSRWCERMRWDNSCARRIASSEVCSSEGIGCARCADCTDEKLPKRVDHQERSSAGEDNDEADSLVGYFAMMSSMNPEKTTIPPPPSGPNPYENALDESGLSTTMREYGGPRTPCGTGGGARPQLSSANLRTYSDARGRGFNG